jgi:deoxyribose-phosphate aldolase
MGDITELTETSTQRILSWLELISVNGDDTSAQIIALCQRGLTPFGNVAAVCVATNFAGVARRTLDQLKARDVKVVAAINASSASASTRAVESQTHMALRTGADEIELVYPIHALLGGNRQLGAQLVAACKAACGRRTALTVTLETGVLRDPQIIREVCHESILTGANFLKTSTGKANVNATPQATRIMIEAIAETGGQVGLKVVGGFRSIDEANIYLQMAASRFGPYWLESGRLRLGAPSLLVEVFEPLPQ